MNHVLADSCITEWNFVSVIQTWTPSFCRHPIDWEMERRKGFHTSGYLMTEKVETSLLFHPSGDKVRNKFQFFYGKTKHTKIPPEYKMNLLIKFAEQKHSQFFCRCNKRAPEESNSTDPLYVYVLLHMNSCRVNVRLQRIYEDTLVP